MKAASTVERRHPVGIYYLAFTEAWERFSFYGMMALLSLYMVDDLLLPPHAASVNGLATLRVMLENVSGPLSTQAFASEIFGLYAGLVYFTPLIGGWFADRWIGQRTAVIAGTVMMAAGHLVMSSESEFLVALLLLVVGSGFLKGNIATQVGNLYPANARALRARGYVIFSVGINIGAVLGPFICGWVAHLYGWHAGFGVAALFILFGLATYLIGFRHLPDPERRDRSAESQLTRAEWRTTLALVAVIGVSILPAIGFYQLYNVMPIWIRSSVERQIGGFTIPIPWFQATTSIFCMLGAPFLFWIWRQLATAGREPEAIGKIAIGAGLIAASNLGLAALALASSESAVSAIWLVAYAACQGVAFLSYWPSLLALISSAAPRSVRSTLIGTSYLSLFATNLTCGWTGKFYGAMTPTEFWLLHAAIALTGGLILLCWGPRLNRRLGIS